MNKLIYIMLAMSLFFASCKNSIKENTVQNDTMKTNAESSFEENASAAASCDIGYEGVAPTDGEPEYIPDGQYAYEDDYPSSDYSEAGSIYDHNGDGEPARNDQYYYQEGYATGRDRAGFDYELISDNNYEFIKGAYLILCNDATFLDADKTNNGHYQLFKQGFLDGWNSVQGALD